MFKELYHVGFITSDIAESKRIYEAFGGVVLKEVKDNLGIKYVYIQIAQSIVELARPEENDQIGWDHVAFLVDRGWAFEDVLASLANKGYEPAPVYYPDGRKTALFNDAANVRFELLQQDDIPRLPGHVNPEIKAFNYVSIVLSPGNAARCDEFYTGAMGFRKKSVRGTPYGRKNLYVHGLDAVELIEVTDEDILRHPINHISICVPDCDAAWKRIRENGVKCGRIRPYPEGYKLFDAFGADGEVIVFTDRLARVHS